MLVGQHVDVHDLANDADEGLGEPEAERDDRTSRRELFVLLVGILHDCHAVGDLRCQ